MTSFKNYVTANIQGLVVKALGQFCQDRDRECRTIQGTPETAFLGASVGDEDAIIPFVANDDTSFILNCSATNNDQASCFLSQRPGSILPKWLSDKIGGSGIWACDSRSVPLIDTKVVIVADCAVDGGSHADGSTPPADVAEEVDAAILDGAELPPEDMSVEDAADGAADLADDATAVDGAELPLDDVSVDDTADAAADLAGDTTAADGTELPPDMSVDDTADVEDTAQDTGADLADDATLADGVPTPPEDASIDVTVQDAAADVVDDTSDAAVPICQNFCDAGVSEINADIPEEVTATDAAPTPAVVSALCGPITAPANSVAVACTNGPINVMLQGATSCVAECAFFDKTEITISADPNAANKFYKTFGDIQFGFFVPYEKITWTAFAPLLSDTSPVTLPSFMGSASVYVFNKEKFDKTGTYVWETQDENGKFKKADYLQLIYQPKDEFFNTTPEFLEQNHITSTGGLMTYRYPCETLLNPQVQCTEVK